MAFFEELFPPDISANMVGGPRFANGKAYMPAGQRITNREALYPLHEYTLAHPVQFGAEFESLRAFFWVVGGDADAFRFKDWSDYRATLANSGATEISAGLYQLARLYRFGSRTFTRPIAKPVAGARIWRTRSGVAADVTASTTLDTTTGRFNVTGHLAGDTYAWAGEFHIPAAFRDPAAAFRVLGTSAMLTEWPSLEIEEVRL
jgi:uncharacterized protein (TIGR02217 family)